MTTREEKVEVAKLEHGGALALAKAAVEYLEAYDLSPEQLQVCAHLLHDAAKLADHAALYRRLASTADAAPLPASAAPAPQPSWLQAFGTTALLGHLNAAVRELDEAAHADKPSKELDSARTRIFDLARAIEGNRDLESAAQ